MTRATPLLAIVPIALLLAGCGGGGDNAPAVSSTIPSPPATATPAFSSTAPASSAAADASTRAHAVLASASSSDVAGRIAFVSTPRGVKITGRITGLEPGSTHGFHIHAKGDCSAPDASSAGGHFNPTGEPHGHPAKGPRHAGDLPNQQANASGVATVDVLAQDIALGTGSDNDILGGAVIVHAKPDDYTSQPSGAAGARIACGVITSN